MMLDQQKSSHDSGQSQKGKNVTSRERVPKSFNHEEPDRVPLDLGGMIMSGPRIGGSAKAFEH